MRTLLLPLFWMVVLPLSAQKVSKEEGTNYALFFYVDKYVPGWPQLPESGKEARAIQLELESNYDYHGELIGNPTKQLIEKKCLEYWSKLKDRDRLFVFFSMQGYFDQSTGKGYLIPADALKKDPERKSWLSFEKLGFLLKYGNGQVLLTVDACSQDGSIIKLPGWQVYPESSNCRERIDAAFKHTVQQCLSTTNTNLRTSGSSPFATLLLELLQKGNAKGVFSAAELAEKMPHVILAPIQGIDMEGEFLFVRKNACLPPLDTDGDGVPDRSDQCPEIFGEATNGCPDAQNREAELRDINAWKAAKAEHSETAYLSYLEHFPDGRFREAAHQALQQKAAQKRDDLSWQWANNKNSRESYWQYLKEHPDGLYREEAEAKLYSWELVPSFPWPPPECALRRRLENDLTKYKTLGEVSRKLGDTLDAHGYTQKGFYKTPNGFALVTQMEQFNEDGSSLSDDSRWAPYPVREISDLWSYFKALVLPSYGYFRVFVFIATDQPYTVIHQQVSKELAAKWEDHGANELSADIRNTKPNINHRLDLLIYEFETPNATKLCAQKCPCRLSDRTHLMNSRLGMLGF